MSRRARLAALLWFFLGLPAFAQDIRLLHVNDVYQLGAAEGQPGGLARLQTLHRRLQAADGGSVLLTFGGDTLSPSVLGGEFKGAPMIAAWNALGVDVAVLGNHEFDFGPEILAERLGESRFPWLAANVLRRGASRPFPGTRPYLVKEIAGRRIGFVGVVTRNTAKVSRPGPDIEFRDPVRTAIALADRLRRLEKVDAVVALTHLDLAEDRRLARSGKVDLILGGHDHFVVAEVAAGKPIFKAGADARDAVLATLHFEAARKGPDRIEWQLLPVDANLPEDPDVAALARRYEDALHEALKTRIGETETPLDARTSVVRSHESAAGNLVADAFREAVQADIAIVNGGALRGDMVLGPGPLTKLDVKRLLPFENHVLKLAVRGADVLALLAQLGDRLAAGPVGSFPQVSGMKVVFDRGRPAGERLVEVRIGDGAIAAEKVYTLAVSDFLAAGNDGYGRLKGAEQLVSEDAGPVETDAVIAYILRHPILRYGNEGRLTVK